MVSILIRSLHRAATSSCAVAPGEAGIWLTRPSSHQPPGGVAAVAGLAAARLLAVAARGQICYRDAASQRSLVQPSAGYVRVAE